MMLPPFVFGLLAAVTTVNCQWLQGLNLTGNHPDEPRWCGKAYLNNSYSAFDPGGQTPPPTSFCGQPQLYVQFKPRYSLYLDTDFEGQFVVKIELSQYQYNLAQDNSQLPWPCDCAEKFVFSINLTSDGTPLVVGNWVTTQAPIGVFNFDLANLGKPSLTPINVTLTGGPEGGNASWTANSTLYYLPDKKSGSVTRIDNVSGGMLFKNTASNQTFQPLLAYGFFGSWNDFLEHHSEPEIQEYADMGFNAITPVIGGNDGAWALDYMNKINLKFMFDLRDQITGSGPQNLTYVAEKVEAVKDAEALVAYFSLDQPDGWQWPFDTVTLAADTIRAVDPYHPVADVLTCQNYYFHEYSAGADIITENVEPIGINSTFSGVTAVNATFGNCGCDMCRGDVRDVSDRLDDLAMHERWLGLWPKTKFHLPQSFSDGDWWRRDPSPEEEYAMTLLALNHGAQSFMSFSYPTTAVGGETTEETHILAPAHGKLARVLATSPVVDFVVGVDRPHPISFFDQAGAVQVDAAYWLDEAYWLKVQPKEALVCVVNGGNVDITVPVLLSVPCAVDIASTPWLSGHNVTSVNSTTDGNGTLPEWTFLSGELIAMKGLPALSTSLFILKLGDKKVCY